MDMKKVSRKAQSFILRVRRASAYMPKEVYVVYELLLLFSVLFGAIGLMAGLWMLFVQGVVAAMLLVYSTACLGCTWFLCKFVTAYLPSPIDKQNAESAVNPDDIVVEDEPVSDV